MRERQGENTSSIAGKTEEQLKKEFATRLRQLRDMRKQTQSQVAKALGFSSESVYQLWEKGDGNLPSAINLRKLALYFGVSADYLLDLQREQPVLSGSREEPEEEEEEKNRAKREVFELATHGKDWDAPEVKGLLRNLRRWDQESWQDCFERVITDVIYLMSQAELRDLLKRFHTPAARQAEEALQQRFLNRPGDRARRVTMHILDLEQAPFERLQRNLLGMEGAELMKARLRHRRQASFTLAISNGRMARNVLTARNLVRGQIENVTVIPLTLGKTQFDATAATTLIEHFVFDYGDYGLQQLNWRDVMARQRIAKLANGINLAFMGIGTTDSEAQESLFARFLEENDLKAVELKDKGVVGNVLYHLIQEEAPGLVWKEYNSSDEKRIVVDMDSPIQNDLFYAISLDTLREVVELGEAEVVIVVKDPTRAKMVRAALEMRWANAVICSLEVAKELEQLLV